MSTITPQHTCPQTAKHCHNKAAAPKSINGFLVVAAARFLPGLGGALSVWVPLTRPRWIIMDENLIRTHFYFLCLCHSFSRYFIFPPLHRWASWCFTVSSLLWMKWWTDKYDTGPATGPSQGDRDGAGDTERDVSQWWRINVSNEEKLLYGTRGFQLLMSL